VTGEAIITLIAMGILAVQFYRTLVRPLPFSETELKLVGEYYGELYGSSPSSAYRFINSRRRRLAAEVWTEYDPIFLSGVSFRDPI